MEGQLTTGLESVQTLLYRDQVAVCRQGREKGRFDCVEDGEVGDLQSGGNLELWWEEKSRGRRFSVCIIIGHGMGAAETEKGIEGKWDRDIEVDREINRNCRSSLSIASDPTLFMFKTTKHVRLSEQRGRDWWDRWECCR